MIEKGTSKTKRRKPAKSKPTTTKKNGSTNNVESAEQVAASLDESAVNAIDDAKHLGESDSDVELEAQEMAEMVAEGGPVAASEDQEGEKSAESSAKKESAAVAAAIDDKAVEAVADPSEPGENAKLDAREMADMVAEGAPVAAAAKEKTKETDISGSKKDIRLETPEAADKTVQSALVTEGVDNGTEPAGEAEIEWDPSTFGPVAAPPVVGPGNPSPDGTSFVFLQEDADGAMRLRLHAIDGSGGSSMDLPFIPTVDDRGPQWSPDGKWLALVGRMSAGSPASVWLAPVDGGDCVLITDHEAEDREPRWSPDGSLLAFVSRRDDRDTICISPPDGLGPIIQMTYGFPGQDDRDPCWSTDSARIAFLRRAIDGDTAGDHVWTVALATGELKQTTKKLANRSSLRWCPSKAQIAFVTDDGEWMNIGVVNPDNSAGWNLASEAGDKGDPQYAPDGTRLMYTRALRGEVRLCERPTSGANAEQLDPGGGVASAPRWIDEKKVMYQFAAATGVAAFYVQENKKDADRTEIPVVDWSSGRPLVAPTFVEFEAPDGLKLGGLLYRDPTLYGATPVVIVLTDEPYVRNDLTFRPIEQALASRGFAVFVLTLPGNPGLGRKIINALRDARNAETEVLDLLASISSLHDIETVDESRTGLLGIGYGGAIALLAAGIRPGAFGPVAAIDPIIDWDDEFDQGSEAWRQWHMRNLGLPVAARGRHAMRSPATFVGVVELPAVILETDHLKNGRKNQIETYIDLATELKTSIDRVPATGLSDWEVGEQAAEFLREHIGENPQPPDPSEAMRTDDI